MRTVWDPTRSDIRGGVNALIAGANGIDPLGGLVEVQGPQNLLAYALRRACKLHDVLHVALGCDASVLGEVRSVSYSVGQAGPATVRAAALALVVLLLNLVLRRPHEFKEAISIAHAWLELGTRARPYAALRLEELMDRPLPEVRERVMAARAPGGNRVG